MTNRSETPGNDFSLDRRELLAYAAVFGPSFLAAQGIAAKSVAADPKNTPVEANGKRYDMKKSINLWAFPYPDKMTLKQCFELAKDAGFDGIEVNYDLESDLSPKATSADLKQIGDMARKIGIQISGVCSFLFWPYSLTSNDPQRRKKGGELALKMIHAARDLGTDNLLVVPGAVYIPWGPEPEPVPNDICEQRARKAIEAVLPEARKAGVTLNLENIFANGFLLSPDEMNRFVDSFNDPHVQIHFDTGNIMQYQFPEHWVDICAKRIRNIHLKEFNKEGGNAFNLHAFRPLLDGTTNWPAVLEALDRVGYRGYLTFEYFFPFRHWPEALDLSNVRLPGSNAGTKVTTDTPKLPGLGEVNWGKFISIAADAGYTGALCVEVEDRAYEGTLDSRLTALQQSHDYLRQFLAPLPGK